MRIVAMRAAVIVANSGEPAAVACEVCESRGVACIALGYFEGTQRGDAHPGTRVCIRCVRASLIELAEATGSSLELKMTVDGTTTRTVC